MTEAQITPKQQLLLWDLVARGGSAFQKDIKPAIDPKNRIALEKLGYVKTSKSQRAKFLEMTDRGWHDLGETEPHLYKDGEPRVSEDRRILQFVLASFSRYARKHGLPLHEIFQPETQSDLPERPTKEEKKSIAQEIRDAFFAIAGHPAYDNVRLSALRAKLKHIDKKDLDAALVAMREAGTVNLMNLDNPRDIESEKDAALKSGIHTFHVLWIDG